MFADDAVHDACDEGIPWSARYMGPRAGLGRIDGRGSTAATVDGTPLQGEPARDVWPFGTWYGGRSGDTEAEGSSASSPRISGDVGEGGPGGIRRGAVAGWSVVFRSWTHCSR